MPQYCSRAYPLSDGVPVLYLHSALFRQQIHQYIPQCHGSNMTATYLPKKAQCNIRDGCNVTHGFREVEIGVVERDRDAIRFSAHRHILLGEGVCTDAYRLKLLCLYAQVSDFRYLRDHRVSFPWKAPLPLNVFLGSMAYSIVLENGYSTGSAMPFSPFYRIHPFSRECNPQI